ncbi:MAG TPA: FAD-dependent oxidoreductase [Kofleriaceae bacterium]|nr:FAD-dependent oxidoreductase [Kofleriaceae bacterium]
MTALDPADPTTAALPASTEVAIIGAGFAGVSTAWALARRGVRAVVLERESAPGRFASGRSAGLGRQLAEDDATTHLTVRGARALRDGFAAWQPCGGILTFDQAAAAEAYAARAAKFQLEAHRLDRAAVLARWPGLAALPIVAGVYVPSDGVIDVVRLLDEFAAGQHIACNAEVERLEASPREVRVGTSRGWLSAQVVVDASGAWAGQLVREPPLAAYKRHVYVLEADPAAGQPFVWHLGSDEMYMRSHEAGLMVSPCDAVQTAAEDQQPDSTGEALLAARLAGSGWDGARVARRWACQRAFTPNRRMWLGEDPVRPWFVWAAGLGGHGATASPAVGEDVAAACARALRAATSRRRSSPRP